MKLISPAALAKILNLPYYDVANQIKRNGYLGIIYYSGRRYLTILNAKKIAQQTQHKTEKPIAEILTEIDLYRP